METIINNPVILEEYHLLTIHSKTLTKILVLGHSRIVPIRQLVNLVKQKRMEMMLSMVLSISEFISDMH